MELTDGAITLRPPRVEDARACFDAVTGSLAELIRWLPWAHEGYERSETETWIAHCAEQWGMEDGDREFFMFDASGTFLGGCGLMRKMPQGEIGYWVRTDACGRGVATAATRLLAGLGADLGLAAIAIRVDPANVASIRVAEKAGGRRERVERHVHDDGTIHELIEFVLDGGSGRG